MRRAILVVATAAVVTFTGNAASSAASCIPASRFSHAQYLAEGTATSIRVGALIDVQLVEPALPTGYPTSFPWVTPRSTNSHVLAAVKLCPHHTTPSSLDVSITLFRAVNVGRAAVFAPVAPAWQLVKTENWPRPFSVRVTVVR